VAGKKEYEAVLSLGAKVAGSFKSAFAAARKSLDNLKKSAATIGKAFAPVWRGFMMAFGAMAAFGAAKVIENIFGGAAAAARDATRRTMQLTAALNANQKLQKLGPDVVKGQVLALQKVSDELRKQGAIHSDHFEAASSTLALQGLGPATIGKWLPVLGDALVATKGVNASIGDMESLTDAVTKAINPGQTKGLREVGIVLDKNEAKNWKAMTPLQRQSQLLDLLKQKFEGANAEAAKTPEGKIQRFNNDMAALSQTIGEKMLPAQGRMAEKWSQALPEAEPAILEIMTLLSNAMADVAIAAADILLPAMTTLNAYFKGAEFKTAIEEFGKAWKELGDALKPLSGIFGETEGSGKSFGEWLASEITQTIKDFTILVEGTTKVIRKIGDAWNFVIEKGKQFVSWVQGIQLPDWMTGKGATPGFTMPEFKWPWEQKKMPEVKEVPALEKNVQKVEFAALDAAKGFDSITVPPVAKELPPIEKETREVEKAGKDVADAFKQWSLPAALTSGLDALKNKVADVQRAMTGGGGALPGHQFGGIFNQPHLAQVAEAGPEAIIPLKRNSERSQGLLANAASAIMGRQQSDNSTTNTNQVSFAPVINIAGNATSDTASTIERSLRDVADDFLNRFNEAQSQERRLAFGT
jgi:hypothetical protein